MARNGAASVDTRHKDYEAFLPEWLMIDDCVKGERAVKLRKQKYLPHPGVKDDSTARGVRRYDNYLKRAAFLNATGRTLQALMGIAFSKPVQIDLSGPMSVLELDADGSGQSLTQLCRESLSTALTRGRYGYWVDYMTPLRNEDGTQSAAQATSNRPRVRLCDATEIINWRVVDGVTQMIVVKYQDQLPGSQDDFQEMSITVWMEMRLVDGKAYARKWVENINDDQSQYIRGISNTSLKPLIANNVHLDRLPFFWGGSENNDHLIDPAPLADIASLNIKHYMAEADIAEIAHIVGQPTLILKGLSKVWADEYLKDGVYLGASTGIKLGVNGSVAMDATILQAEERNASTLLAERREEQMAKLGAALVQKGTAPKTATEAEYDAKTDNSILSLAVGNVQAALNAALEMAARFAGGSGKVEINQRYSELTIDSAALTAMMAGVQNGTIRLIDLIKYLQGAGIVDATMKPEAIEDELRNQDPLPNMLALVQAGMSGQAAKEDNADNPDDEKQPQDDAE